MGCGKFGSKALEFSLEIYDLLAEPHWTLLEALRESPVAVLTGAEIAKRCGLGRRDASVRLRRLRDSGLVVQVERGAYALPGTPAIAVARATRPDETIISAPIGELPARLAAEVALGEGRDHHIVQHAEIGEDLRRLDLKGDPS